MKIEEQKNKNHEIIKDLLKIWQVDENGDSMVIKRVLYDLDEYDKTNEKDWE